MSIETMFLTMFDLRSSIVLTFSIAAHLVCYMQSLTNYMTSISEYDKEMPQWHTADQPTAPREKSKE